MRVLVVDDDFMVAKVHAAFVARTPGFEVVGTAHSGQEAWDAVGSLQPDLVLLDVYLPDMTGLDLLQRLRASDAPAADVDVVVVTAANDADSVRRALRGGVSGYLIKPFHYDDLRLRLEQAAQRRRGLERLEGPAGAEQRDVDRVVAPGATRRSSTADLPKGVSAETMGLVQRVLREAGEQGLSASECAERTGMSRVSARRYLEHLTQVGRAEVSAKYGGTGRPERRFRAS